MATADNGHVLEGAEKNIAQNGNKSKRTSPLRWTMGLVVRLCIWYALLTPFLRCPSRLSELNESSPRVCKPYLVVRSHIEPHVSPYYQTYGAPYVDVARPYVHALNQHVYTPVAKVTKQGYEKYGAPALDQAQVYGQQQWDAQVVPHLNSAQDKLSGIYKNEVDPYVQHAMAAVSPYYNKANVVITTAYGDYILPFYAQSAPFIGKTYSSGQEILTTTVMPYAQNTWTSVIFFANSSLWPKVTGLYSENVEPQLVKIGQRLASYREGKRVRAVVDEVDSSTPEQPTSVSSASVETSVISQVPSSTTEVLTQTTLSATEKAAQARERIALDLHMWREKFAVAADKGVEDLQERVNEIVDSHVKSGVHSHGESLATALDAVVEDELSNVKLRINALAESLPFEDRPRDEEIAQNELLKVIKLAAISIRERAHALREWHSAFDDELMRRVLAAVNSTLDVLDSVRDLGLQEIGMRWAWMDGVTYKDWAKYHELKAQFEDWRNEVRQAGTQNTKLEEASASANTVLVRAMEVAESAAKELGKLKDVGKWKISAREVGENFDTRSETPPPLPKATQVSDEPEPAELESESAEKLRVQDAEATDIDLGVDDDQILGDDQESNFSDEEPAKSFAQDRTSKPNDPLKKAWGGAAAQAIPGQMHMFPVNEQFSEPSSTRPLDYISSVASSRLSEGLSFASAQLAQVKATVSPTPTSAQNPILLDAQRRYYEALGLAHDQYTAFVSSASDAVYGSPAPTTPPGSFQGLIQDARSQYQQASSLASASLAAVLASVSSAVGPEDKTTSQGIIEDASSRYQAAISAASASLSVASVSASSAIYGTPTGSLEFVASRASENWEGLVSKASEQVYGTQEPYAQQVFNHVVPQYEAIEGLVSELLVGKEPSVTDQVISQLRAIYETPYPASALSSASSYVSEAYESASSASSPYVTDIPTVDDILDSANEQLKSALGAASVQIYGTPKGHYEEATSAAAGAYTSASVKLSEAVYGTEPGYVEVASSAIDEAVSSAGSAISKAIYTATSSPTDSASGVYASATSIAAEQQVRLESATSKLGVAVESAQAALAGLVSTASSFASEVVETAASQVEDLQETKPAAKDEL